MTAETTFHDQRVISTRAAEHTFTELFRAYHSRLVRYSRFRTGDEAAAEDIAQEALLRALHHGPSVHATQPLWPWLKTVAANLSVDHVRRRECEARATEALSQEAEQRLADDVLSWLEERPVLHEAFQALPPRQRQALWLRYLDQASMAEAAEVLEMSPLAFRQLLLRARRALTCEYRRLGGLGKRVAGLLPVGLVLGRLRTRMLRASGWLGQVSVSSAAVTADAAATLAIVVAVTGVVAVNFAQAAVRPLVAASSNVEAIQEPQEIQPVVRARELPARAEPVDARRAAASARGSVSGPHAAAERPAAGAVEVSAIRTLDVVVDPVDGAAPKRPKAEAKVKREGDTLSATHLAEVVEPVDTRAVGDVAAAGDVNVDCTSDARRAACNVAEAGIEMAAPLVQRP